MDTEVLRYDKMVEYALRDVVRSALAYTAEHGLPGEHHFYITFETEAEGVEIPRHLRGKYPEEMTIVLQHKFWGLKVDDGGFEVMLTFNDVPQRLVVPLNAVTAFFDPSVQFGLKFQAADQTDATAPDKASAANAEAPPAGDAAAESSPEDVVEPDKVVTLDAFRKK